MILPVFRCLKKRTKTFRRPSDGSSSHNRRFYAVLRLGPVQSARDAVRASIVQVYREETKNDH